jgi:hypothetical protein
MAGSIVPYSRSTKRCLAFSLCFDDLYIAACSLRKSSVVAMTNLSTLHQGRTLHAEFQRRLRGHLSGECEGLARRDRKGNFRGGEFSQAGESVTVQAGERSRLSEHRIRPIADPDRAVDKSRRRSRGRLHRHGNDIRWDTHTNQGGSQGQLSNFLRTFSQSIAAFAIDLGSRMDDVVLLTMSEFGRTARENGGREQITVTVTRC